MILTETEKRDWELILSTIPPCEKGETDEEKTARFDAHASWLATRIYYLQKACKDLGNLQDERFFKDNANAFKEAAENFVSQLEHSIYSLGGDAAQYAFKNGVSLALKRLEEEQTEAET